MSRRIKAALLVAAVSPVLWHLGMSDVGTAQAAGKWQFRKQTTSNNCVVQTSDSQPILGDLISEHDTRKAACQAAADRYDKTMDDATKCWVYGPGTKTGCAQEDITLPPN